MAKTKERKNTVDAGAVSPLQRLEKLLENAGACAFGIAEAEEVPAREWDHFERWIADGMHAGMHYMECWQEIRRDPRLLLEGAKSVISIAFNYRQPNPYPEIATYALGEDYHKVLRRRLKTVTRTLKEEFGGEYRICIDSAPILERYWAWRCGVGERSQLSGNIVVPGVGSMVFLAEIITTLDFPGFCAPKYSYERGPGFCGREANGYDGANYALPPCPTGALLPGGRVDARRCINYLTIEHQGDWNEEQKTIMDLPGASGKVFGCDICQLACHSNRSVPKDVISEFKPLSELPQLILAIKSGDLENTVFKLPTPLNRWLRRYGKR